MQAKGRFDVLPERLVACHTVEETRSIAISMRRCRRCRMLVSSEFFIHGPSKPCVFCYFCRAKSETWKLNPTELYVRIVSKPLRCELCAGKHDYRFGALTLHNLSFDHIIPVSRGGENVLRNLALVHHQCNGIKGDRPHGLMQRVLQSDGALDLCGQCNRVLPTWMIYRTVFEYGQRIYRCKRCQRNRYKSNGIRKTP